MNDKKLVNTSKPLPCAAILTDEDIKRLEFDMEEWIDALEQIEKADYEV